MMFIVWNGFKKIFRLFFCMVLCLEILIIQSNILSAYQHIIRDNQVNSGEDTGFRKVGGGVPVTVKY